MSTFKVRWKGKYIGEFSKEEMDSNLLSSKMGMLHQVYINDKWISPLKISLSLYFYVLIFVIFHSGLDGKTT